ncbi:MAG: hypothetical protein Q4G40_09730 [Brachybacterium sp.]|nr:hypothetical protein [Brachybacterium sp.]
MSTPAAPLQGTRQQPRVAHHLAMLPVRWSGMACAIAFALAGAWVQMAVALLVALEQVIAWRARLPIRWEIATSVTCLIAAISSYLFLYERIPWWDKPVHFALTGLLAVLGAWVLERWVLGRTRLRARTIVIAGVLLAVVWEVMEWWGHHYVDPRVYIPLYDTVTDILAGVLGTIAAAWLWRRHRPHQSAPL